MPEFPADSTTEAFLEAARYAGDVIAADRVGRRWHDSSALKMMSVGDVAGHLFLVMRRVGKRAENLSTPETPTVVPMSIQGWTWVRVVSEDDLDQSDHRQVREDAARVAGWGWEQARDAYLTRVDHLSRLLRGGCPSGVEISGRSRPFSDYLATRIVELLVHTDDLACSVGLDAPFPNEASDIAIRLMVDAARSVHGDGPVLRALTRYERVPGGISVF